MQNFELMQGLKPNDGLNQDAPDLVLLEELFLLFVVDYLLIEVAVIGKLHHDTA